MVQSRQVRSAALHELVDCIPEGWTLVSYAGRHWGLSRVSRVGGRVITVFAEELGGSGMVSANVYRTADEDVLRACEMPHETVLSFLRGWHPVVELVETTTVTSGD